MKRTNTYDCKHKYEMGKVLPGKANCVKCGLLKSTIDAENTITQTDHIGKDNKMVEDWRERFRKNIAPLTDSTANIEQFISEELSNARDEFEKRLEDYRNSPEVWKNVGISKWRNWGEQCGYFKFFKQEAEREVKDIIWGKLMDCLPKDAENLSTLTPDQKIRLLDKFLKIY